MLTPTKYSDGATERLLGLLGVTDKWAGISWPLPNMKEITLGHYFCNRSSWTPRAEVSTGQFKVSDHDPSGVWHPHWGYAFITLLDNGRLKGGGFALLYTYNHMDWRTRPLNKYADALGSKDAAHPCIRAFEWCACDHDWQETGPVERRSRGWHVYSCGKCGETHTIDSGDCYGGTPSMFLRLSQLGQSSRTCCLPGRRL